MNYHGTKRLRSFDDKHPQNILNHYSRLVIIKVDIIT